MPRHIPHHDVYDDTPYGPEGIIEYPPDEYTRRRGPRRHHHRRHRGDPFYAYPGPHAHPHGAPMPLAPFHPMDPWAMEHTMEPFFAMDPFSPAGQEMERSISPFGAPSLFRGMMSSIDRLWDEMAATATFPSAFPNSPGGAHYYFESKTRTVGPDGRVREETLRTVPGADGQPETRRTVREGEHSSRMRSVFDAHVPHSYPPGYRPDNDVVVEEIDDDGNVVPNDDDVAVHRSSPSRYDDRFDNAFRNDHHSGGWLRNQYRRWRSRE